MATPSSSIEATAAPTRSDSTAAVKKKIEFPTNRDILLGRGRPYQEYPGNVALSEIIEPHRQQYQSANRFDKTCISKMVVQIVKEQLGARFLQRAGEDSDEWQEVADSVAREKVSHGFRTKTRRGKYNSSPMTTTNELISKKVGTSGVSASVDKKSSGTGVQAKPDGTTSFSSSNHVSNSSFQPFMQQGFSQPAVLPRMMNWPQQHHLHGLQNSNSMHHAIIQGNGGGGLAHTAGTIEPGRISLDGNGSCVDQRVSFPSSHIASAGITGSNISITTNSNTAESSNSNVATNGNPDTIKKQFQQLPYINKGGISNFFFGQGNK